MRYVVLLVAVCGVASAALWARLGLDAGLNPLSLSAWRLGAASVALLVWRVARFREPLPDRRTLGALAIAGLFLGLHFVTWFASLEYTSVARSTLLVGSTPIWAGIAGFFVPSLRPKPIFWTGLALAIAGTVIVATQSGSLKSAGSPLIGDGLAIVGAICIVPYLLISQKAQTKLGTVETVTWMYVAAACGLWIACVAVGEVQLPVGMNAWGSILGMAIFAQLIGHSLFNLLLKSMSAAQVSTGALLEPVFAALLAWPILGEAIGPWQAVGGLVLLGGVALALSR